MIPPYEGREVNELVKIEYDNYDYYQLYNLKEDMKKQNNLAKINPEKPKELIHDFEIIHGNEYNGLHQL
ncbi:MAG: hypothetical protein HN443_06100 [Flavobacteriaceae bacterium]|jgi:hypothetical protein|nr:hypothetical protein [Flavobacteriaceae bacterium]